MTLWQLHERNRKLLWMLSKLIEQLLLIRFPKEAQLLCFCCSFFFVLTHLFSYLSKMFLRKMFVEKKSGPHFAKG